MLKHLTIKNVAVIERANIDFGGGFNVLTGETGAGKSIIIDSINMLRGDRASRALIRGGETKARVDGEFEIDSSAAEEIADILGSDPEKELIISRELSSDGKNTIRINGMPANITMLKLIGEKLIDIHGQHDTASLLSVKTHIDFLDSFGKEKIAPVLESYKELHSRCVDIQNELDSINTNEQEKLHRHDLLMYQKEEIEDADIKIGEDEELEKRKILIDNSAKIAENTNAAYDMLYGNDEVTAHDLLWGAVSKLEEISDFDAEINDIYSVLSEAGYAIGDKVRELKDFCDHISFDAEEAEETEQRLEVIYNMKRKYGASIEKINLYYENICSELNDIDSSDERAAELESELDRCKEKREKAAKELTDLRKKYGTLLSEHIEKQLEDLNMAKVEFKVRIDDSDYKPDGADSVEFLIRTNVGEDLKPLAKIASGGELSRIMLAVKNVLSGFDMSKTVIFDEIDTGVSGKAAQKIGEKLYSMSRSSQVLCITHLPQIAAFADNQYLIEKHVEDGRTLTRVNILEDDARVCEIARTLGGADITEIALSNAKQLISDAQKIKNRSGRA